MGGYVRPPLQLQFVGEEFDGLRVWAKRISLRKLDHLVDLANSAKDAGDDPKRQLKVADELFTELLPCLLAWNFQVAENPMVEDSPRRDVPLTMDGLRDDGDLVLALAIVEGLMDAMGGVPAPLPTGSADGSPSLADLPMTAAQ